MEIHRGPICQSCAMPLQKEDDHGTNEDGTRCDEYCVHCFRFGKFIDEGITLEEKIEKNVESAVKMGWDETKARITANNVIPNLKRWRNG